MKTNVFMAVFMLALVSCHTDESVTELYTAESLDTLITLNATMGDETLSRAQVQLDNTDTGVEYFQWNEGDTFCLYDVGLQGKTVPTGATIFTISANYDDNNPSNSATFTAVSDINDGNSVVAVYPMLNEIGSGGTLTLAIADTVLLKTNSDDEIKEYMTDNMYMYGTSQLSYNITFISFSHLTTMVRIVYANASETEQAVTSVRIAGDSDYFGTESSFSIVGASGTVTSKTTSMGMTFDDVTVAVGDSMDFYIMFFHGDDFKDDGTLAIEVNGQTVEMKTMDIQTDNFNAGYRYKFKVTQTSNGLIWTSEYSAE